MNLRSHSTPADTKLIVLIVGTDRAQAAQLGQDVCSSPALRSFANPGSPANKALVELTRIGRDVAERLGTGAGEPLSDEGDFADQAETLPIRRGVESLRALFRRQSLVAIDDGEAVKSISFWSELAGQCGCDLAVLLVFSQPVVNRAEDMALWLRNMLAAERATRGLPRMVVTLAAAEDAAHWLAARIRPNRASGVAGHRREWPAAHSSILPPGFNSWVRRCESAFRQLARNGEEEPTHREFDRLHANLIAAQAMLGPALEMQRLDVAHLGTENTRLQTQIDTLHEMRRALEESRDRLAADAAAYRVRGPAHEAELAQAQADAASARQDGAALRQSLDVLSAQGAQARAGLLEVQMQLGRVAGEHLRAANTLIARAEQQIARSRRPIARWLKRRGWAHKVAKRLERQIDIIERFLDDVSWPLIGVHPEGRRRRILAYLVGASEALPDFPIIQNIEYRAMHPDVANSPMPPLVHFIRYGQSELRNPHPLFDTRFYLEQCPEAEFLTSSPLVHYLKWGKDKGHNPHPLLHTEAYLDRYPDVRASGRNPLVHWIAHPLVTADPRFDARFYLETYPDIAREGINPLTHYLIFGWREGRNPNPWFDTSYYLAHDRDVADAGINPLIHYVTKGWRARLAPGPRFDPAFYLANDPNLTSEQDPLLHYLEHGRAEGRLTFDETHVAVTPPARSAAPAPVPVSPFVRSAARGPARDIVVMIDASYPRPDLDSGSLDQTNFVRIFQALGFEVHFLSLLEFGRDLDDRTQHYRQALTEMDVFCVRSQDYPYVEEYYFDVADRAALFFASRVHFGGQQIATLRELCPDSRVVFNTVDLHFMREEREGVLKEDTALILRAGQTRNLELDCAIAADAVIVVSSSEKVILDELVPEANTHVVPLIRQFNDTDPAPFRARRDIAFIGGFNHHPNVDAVEHFLASVWPLLHKRRPDIGFRIIGANMPKAWHERRVAGVTFVGFVEDLEGELASLRMTVAPLRYGAGAKGKLVSSLAAGVPAVVSGIAAEGMGLVDGQTILTAEIGPDFVERIIALYDDHALWTRLSGAGSAFIRRNYSLETGLGLMSDILAGIDVATPAATVTDPNRG